MRTYEVTHTYTDAENRVISQPMGRWKASNESQARNMALKHHITDPDQRDIMRPNVVATEVTEKALAV